MFQLAALKNSIFEIHQGIKYPRDRESIVTRLSLPCWMENHYMDLVQPVKLIMSILFSMASCLNSASGVHWLWLHIYKRIYTRTNTSLKASGRPSGKVWRPFYPSLWGQNKWDDAVHETEGLRSELTGTSRFSRGVVTAGLRNNPWESRPQHYHLTSPLAMETKARTPKTVLYLSHWLGAQSCTFYDPFNKLLPPL